MTLIYKTVRQHVRVSVGNEILRYFNTSHINWKRECVCNKVGRVIWLAVGQYVRNFFIVSMKSSLEENK